VDVLAPPLAVERGADGVGTCPGTLKKAVPDCVWQRYIPLATSGLPTHPDSRAFSSSVAADNDPPAATARNAATPTQVRGRIRGECRGKQIQT
jgi:hypothetical protein